MQKTIRIEAKSVEEIKRRYPGIPLPKAIDFLLNGIVLVSKEKKSQKSNSEKEDWDKPMTLTRVEKVSQKEKKEENRA